MTDKNDQAMPCELPREIYPGLTAQEYAAIHLKVADSGTPWLDEMIEKSRRDEFAKAALQASLTNETSRRVIITEKFYKGICEQSYRYFADNMLAASKEEK